MNQNAVCNGRLVADPLAVPKNGTVGSIGVTMRIKGAHHEELASVFGGAGMQVNNANLVANPVQAVNPHLENDGLPLLVPK